MNKIVEEVQVIRSSRAQQGFMEDKVAKLTELLERAQAEIARKEVSIRAEIARELARTSPEEVIGKSLEQLEMDNHRLAANLRTEKVAINFRDSQITLHRREIESLHLDIKEVRIAAMRDYEEKHAALLEEGRALQRDLEVMRKNYLSYRRMNEEKDEIIANLAAKLNKEKEND